MLSHGFLRSVHSFPDRRALEVSGQVLTYADLFHRAAALAATLDRHQPDSQPPLTAVFAYRSATAFAGVLGALLRGHGYVPLNRTFPPERTRTMLMRSGCRSMVVDNESAKQLDQALQGIEPEMLVVLPELSDVRDFSARWPMHRFVASEGLSSCQEWHAPEVSSDSLAYLMFTSGSTGTPKGVMVTHGNVRHYIDSFLAQFPVSHEDRFSQTFDMTFDLSVADMFVAWERGACVCCPSAKALINPGHFINDSGLTIWFSVPSTAMFMKRLGALKPGTYPGLRLSMFCGEALPVELARAWAEASPASEVVNLYGPTELTIACTCYGWDSARSSFEANNGVVPIGEPFPRMLPLVVDESLNEVMPGQDGELLMTGPQLSPGYWQDPVKTSASFITIPGRTEAYYRTGDRVRKPAAGEPILYLGRFDNQVKVLGHRVELGEVEAVVRRESGVDGVVAVGWPRTPAGAGGVEVFLEIEGPEEPGLKERIARHLPAYMVPRRFHCLPGLPLNVNGKYDRHDLMRRLESDTSGKAESLKSEPLKPLSSLLD